MKADEGDGEFGLLVVQSPAGQDLFAFTTHGELLSFDFGRLSAGFRVLNMQRRMAKVLWFRVGNRWEDLIECIENAKPTIVRAMVFVCSTKCLCSRRESTQ